MPLEFRYFRGPESDMGFLPYLGECSLCGQTGQRFSLDGVTSRELSEEERKGKTGCYNCLSNDRFGFDHTTDVGFITIDGLIAYPEPSNELRRVFIVASAGEATAEAAPLIHPPQPHVSEEAIAELRRTPSCPAWQEVSWPVHCDDFMAYLGIWGPEDFEKAAANSLGRDLFLESVEPDFHRLWPETHTPKFDNNIVAFQCLHCSAKTGIPDFD